MQRVVELAGHFKVPCMVCINKFDLNPDQTAVIQSYARVNDIPVVGRVPFDKQFTDSLVLGQTIVEFCGDNGLGASIKQVWKDISSQLN